MHPPARPRRDTFKHKRRAISAARRSGDGPCYRRQQQNQKRQFQRRQKPRGIAPLRHRRIGAGRIFVAPHRNFAVHHFRGNEAFAAHLAPHERRDLFIFLGLAIQPRHRRNEASGIVRADANLAEQVHERRERRVLAARAVILAHHHRGVRLCHRQRHFPGRRRTGEIAVGEIVEQLFAQVESVGVAPRAVQRNEQPDIFVQEQRHRAVEEARIAVMADDAMAVAVKLEESERHAIERRANGCVRRAMHLLRCRGLKNAMAVIFAVLKMRDHEPGDVGPGSRQPAGRRCAQHLEGAGLIGRRQISARHQRRQRRGWRLQEGRMIHAKRREDVLRDVLREGLPGNPFHDVAGKRGAIVGIGRHLARRKNPRRHPILQKIAKL